MFDKATEKTLRLIAAAMHLKKVHGLEFAVLMLKDAGLLDGVARAALQDEQDCSEGQVASKYCQSDDIHLE